MPAPSRPPGPSADGAWHFGGSTPAVAAGLTGAGIANGFVNVLSITAFQRWAPPALLGRLFSLLLLTSYGMFPISVALAAALVRGYGPVSFFILGSAMLAVAILAGVAQQAWRDFGLREDAGQGTAEAVPTG